MGPVQTNVTDRRGRLLAEQVQAGKYEAVAKFEGRSTEKVEVTVVRDGSLEIELTLPEEER